MKILNILLVSALGRRIGYDLKINIPDDKRALLINLRTMQRNLAKPIVLYNSSIHGHKREIKFDPALLGCIWGFKRSMACTDAEVSNNSDHLATEGLVINPRK